MTIEQEPLPERGRVCLQCGGTISPDKYRSAQYCTSSCRNSAAQVRFRENSRDKFNALHRRSRAGHPEYGLKRREADRQEKQAGSGKGLLMQKRQMLAGAQARAKAKGLPFAITLEDFTIPEVCPALGVEILLGGNMSERDQAPSLDRVMPALGYVPGNVIVISNRANRIKNNATIPELQRIADFFTKLITTGGWMTSLLKTKIRKQDG